MAISSPSAHIVFTIPTFLDALLGRLEASSLHACARWLVLHLQWSSICLASWLHNKNEKSSRNNNEKSSSNNEIQEFQIYQRKEFETTSSILWRHTRLGLVQESFLSLASFPNYCLAYWLSYWLKLFLFLFPTVLVTLSFWAVKTQSTMDHRWRWEMRIHKYATPWILLLCSC